MFATERRPAFIKAAVTFTAIVGACVATCPAAIRVEAYRGEPFGVGRVIVDLERGASSDPLADDRFTITEANGRVFYPAIENAPVRRMVRNLLGIETPWQITFYFIFRGGEPLEMTLFAPDAQPLTVRTERNAREFNELLEDWWDATEDRYEQVFRLSEYPIVVENFLTATWARRLGREMPQPGMFVIRQIQWGDPWISQLMANEAYQNNVERDLLLGRFAADGEATIELPAARFGARRPGPVAAATSPRNVEELPAPGPSAQLPAHVEPIAGHVPHECFYLRFGNFPNYLWFRDFTRHWQGDLTNMLVQKSVNHNVSDRFQRQIAVGENRLARVMGPTVVRDVAIIGFDPYMRDGAAMGILFQANNSMLLTGNLNDQRRDAMNTHTGATEETIRVAEHDVSYIASPDGRLRSYYAIDGDFHLVTTSRRLVERFFEAGRGTASLGASEEFQAARDVTPLEREDTIFLYASAAFFENLASPHYRIELDRRLRSIGEMRAIEIARLAARVEGHDSQSVADLIEADLLPPGFGERADGSRLVVEPSPSGRGQGEGEPRAGFLRDSLRGIAGAMVPIPDMPVERITRAEAARLSEFDRNIRTYVGRFAPLTAALKRDTSPVSADWDRITVEVRLSQYARTGLGGLVNLLAPATAARVAPIEGDVASLELVFNAAGQLVHLFGGLRDFRTPLVVRQGEVRADAPAPEFIRAYVGGWPRPHLLDGILGRPTGPFDDEGIARTNGLFDLWLRRADDFFLFSFKRDVLLEVGQQLAMVEAERPAQARLFIDDLSNKQVATAVSGLGYMRARNTSASGARFMNSLVTQLHVPPEEARELAEQLVGGKFDCPLGGDYALVDPNIPLPARGEGLGEGRRGGGEEALPPPAEAGSPSARQLWVSTATPPENRFLLTEIPADYRMPMMDWFRGVTADVARDGADYVLHAELDMMHIEVGPPEDPGTDESGILSLPGLRDLFGGSNRSQGGQVKPASADEDVPSNRR
jgi:hypothetical protein